MTVGELLEELKELPRDLKVTVGADADLGFSSGNLTRIEFGDTECCLMNEDIPANDDGGGPVYRSTW